MIPFTQFIRPNGRRKLVHIERPPEIEAKAQQIIDSGLRFECEHLGVPPGLPDISLTITHPQKGYLAIELCCNGPAVPLAVDKLIMEFKL